MVSYVTKIKLGKGLDDDGATWFTMDGEAKQLMSIMGQESQDLLSNKVT